MNWDSLSIGWSGSVVANLMLLATMESIPALPWRGHGTEAGEAVPATALAAAWRPFIHNPGWGRTPMRHPCPEPGAAGMAFRLERAPLPRGYDPFGRGDDPLHACVLVHPDGRIGAVALLGTTRRPGLKLQFAKTIASQWRFTPVETTGRPSWQRVRLDAGPPAAATPGQRPRR